MTKDRTACRDVAGGFIPLRAYRLKGLTMAGFRFLAELFLQLRSYGRSMVTFEDLASEVWPSQKVVNKLDKVIAELCRLNIIRLTPPDQNGDQRFRLLNEAEWGKHHEVQSTN